MIPTIVIALMLATVFAGAQDLSEPPGSDNPDCNVRDSVNHTYLRCTFACGDEAEALTNGEKCVLQGTSVVPPAAANPSARAMMNTGICKDGECIAEEQEAIKDQGVQASDGETTSGTHLPLPGTTEASDDGLKHQEETSVSPDFLDKKQISTSEWEPEPISTTEQQQEQGSTTESDPDCGASKDSNHVYVSCTYSCERDEAFTAPDNSTCHVSDTNGTLLALNATGVANNIEGRCKDGTCVKINDTERMLMGIN